MTERLPHPDRSWVEATVVRTGDVTTIVAGTHLVRVHAHGGPHPMAWDEFRSYGPTTSRFDHQTVPRRDHPTRAIAYLAHGPTRFVCGLGEYFQDASGGVGPIDGAHREPVITQIEVSRDLRLLDLGSGWVTRAGGNQAIISGLRSRSRAWARAIYATHTDIDGLAYDSSVWGPGRCIALWERGRDAFPLAPVTSRLLADPGMSTAVANAALDLGTYVI